MPEDSEPTQGLSGAESNEIGLDPEIWTEFRATAHRMLDEAIDLLSTVRERPVWRPIPERVRTGLAEPLPLHGAPFEEVCRQFQDLILPYATGNIHPRFWGWVHGTGMPGGIISEMLAACMNSNCGGREHGAIYVERSVVDWCKTLFGFPAEASGLLVSGTSMANLVALTVARNSLQDAKIRAAGLNAHPRQLIAYASAEAHDSIVKAMEILGIGGEAVRSIPVDERFKMKIPALREAIARDRSAGLEPFCVVGTAGTVNTGAVDDLEAVASICEAEGLWFHVDGAFGALSVLSDSLRPLLNGISRADSIGFDFHKWMFVQYDAGCVLIRRGDLHQAAFSMRPPYLKHAKRGLAGGTEWPCEFGPELSRGFRALKVWFAMKEHGTEKFGRIIQQNCSQARYLASLVAEQSELELLAPVELNIVCFRYRHEGFDRRILDEINEEIVADLQETGIAAPSTTRIHGSLAIRVAITNHRSRRADFDLLVREVLSAGRLRAAALTDAPGIES